MIATTMTSIVPRIYKHKKQIHKNTVKVGRLNAFNNLPIDQTVYILVFNYGNYNNGLYSIQERINDEIPQNIIIAFSSYDDAMKYGTRLGVMMGQTPTVEMTQLFELQTLCRECGYKCMVASTGSNLFPPNRVVKVTDCERSNALRMGQWSVQDPKIESQRQMLSKIFNMDSDEDFSK
tara:strand:- start:837 stop:1370 length:534 start_codon:yes stop_codon:yes gene_type:complete